MLNSKTFRLFLSSTFNDFRAERDKLQAEVFPKLRKYCEDRGFSFQPIDLRWGVSFEAGFDQKTMHICLDEVERCKNTLNPHFAIMLGERYGWIPLPTKINEEEFELIKETIFLKYFNDKKVKEYIELWYKKDENSIPSEYLLQPRIEKEHQDWEYWNDVENTLREVFRFVVNNELKDKLNDNQKFKYIKSATEQEIIEGLFNNKAVAKNNIYFYNRRFENIDNFQSKEFLILEAKDKKYKEKDNTYQITVKHFSDFKNFTQNKLDYEIRPYHHELINKIKLNLPKENIKTYNLKLDQTLERTQDSVTQDYLQKFADDFYETIFASIKKEIDKKLEQTKENPNNIEIEQQKSFLNEKAKIFVGRKEFLNTINRYIICNKSEAPLIIYADSGSGKSALMAKAIKNTIKNYSNDNISIIYRFIGTSELSNNPLNLYKSIYIQLNQNEDLEKICNDYLENSNLELVKVLNDLKELSKIIANMLEKFPNNKKLVLFIDALDQFIITDQLDWLPKTLLSNIKIIISSLSDENYSNIHYISKLKEKYKDNKDNFLFLEKLKLNEASFMIDEYLKSFNRTLTQTQKQKLLKIFAQNALPLYLKILLEEAKDWHSYTNISNEKYPKELENLIVRLFNRLHTHSHHSLTLINYAFAYIACSKNGLVEAEMFDILSQEENIMDDVANEFYPKPNRLPVAVWARLYVQMAHYFSIKQINGIDQISFFHRKFNEGAYKLNLNFIKENKEFKTNKNNQTTKEDVHTKLSRFYNDVYNKNLKVDTSIESVLTELPYQLIMSNQKEKALSLLTDFEFLMKKFKLNRTQEILEDFTLAKAMGINNE